MVFPVVEELEEHGFKFTVPIVLAEVVEEEPRGAEARLDVFAGEGGDLVVAAVAVLGCVLEAVGCGPSATDAGAHGAHVEEGEAAGLGHAGKAYDAKPEVAGGVWPPPGDGGPEFPVEFGVADVGGVEVGRDGCKDFGLDAGGSLGGDALGLCLFLGGVASIADGLDTVAEFLVEDDDGFEPIALAAIAALALDHDGFFDGGGCVHFWLGWERVIVCR